MRPPMSETFIDPAAIDELRSLEDDNPGFFSDIIHQFLDDDAPARLVAIHDALEEGDLSQVGKEAHGLKNSCSVVGASHMRDLCQRIEKSVRVEPSEMRALVGELRRSFESIAVELRRLAAR